MTDRKRRRMTDYTHYTHLNLSRGPVVLAGAAADKALEILARKHQLHHNVAEWWSEVSIRLDPFGSYAELCVNGRATIDGLEFACTGHEHRFGLHTLCISARHYHTPEKCLKRGTE